MSQPNGKHTTKAEVERRVTEVYGLLVAGISQRKIIERGRARWDVSERSVRLYIAKATALIQAEGRRDRRYALGRALARLDRQYGKADARDDHRGAAVIAAREIELLLASSGREEERGELRTWVDAMLSEDG